MDLRKLDGIVPNRRACFDLLVLIETEYNCSIKMWLDANNPRGGEIGWSVYATGSGGVFDHSGLDSFCSRARVLDAEEGSIYPAIWSCLRALEQKLSRLTETEFATAHP